MHILLKSAAVYTAALKITQKIINNLKAVINRLNCEIFIFIHITGSVRRLLSTFSSLFQKDLDLCQELFLPHGVPVVDPVDLKGSA